VATERARCGVLAVLVGVEQVEDLLALVGLLRRQLLRHVRPSCSLSQHTS